MYILLYHPQVFKQISKLHPTDQKKVIKRLEGLAKKPLSRKLNIRKLAKTKRSYRLRIGDVRVIYELDNKLKTIYIWQIGYRGGIY